MPGVKAATPAGSVREDSSSEEEQEEDKSSWSLKIIDPKEDSTSKCKLCFKTAQDPDEESSLRLGPLYSYGYCLAHHFCLMFSSGLNQEGEDEEGIKGFLPDSIVKEWRRGSMLKCFYCKQKYATVGCAHSACKRGYHLSCGIENGSLQQFYGNFASSCSSHRPVQAPLAKVGSAPLHLKEAECGVCLDDLEEVVGHSVLWTPCCGGWFHRPCVERMAAAAGSHHFKCPLCNNKDDFTEEMKEFGIYVPDQDAEWEAGDAFGDQLQRHDRCDADDCLCPDGMQHPEGKVFEEGRMYDEEDTEWEIMLCVCCGHQGMHVKCGSLSLARPRWKCPFCKGATAHLPSLPIPVFTRMKRAANPPDQEQSRRVLTNLTFRVTNQQIDVEVHRNRRDPKDPVVARFRVTSAGVPPQVPLPVAVRKEVKEKQGDTIRNIPCPVDDCNQLLNRIEFHKHLAEHRGETVEEEEEEELVVKDSDGDVTSYQELSKATIVSGAVRSGKQVQVKEASGEVYPAKVLKMRVKEGRCLVHYKGWSSKWDEWLAIPVDQGQEGVEGQEVEVDSVASSQEEEDEDVTFACDQCDNNVSYSSMKSLDTHKGKVHRNGTEETKVKEVKSTEKTSVVKEMDKGLKEADLVASKEVKKVSKEAKEASKEAKEIGKEAKESGKEVKEASASAKRKPSTSSQSSSSDQPAAKKQRKSSSAETPSRGVEKDSATPSPSTPNLKTPSSLASRSKTMPRTDEKQSSILSFFAKFKPKAASEGSPNLKKKLDTKRRIEKVLAGEEVEEKKVSPSQAKKAADPTVVKSSLGFFKLDKTDNVIEILDNSKDDDVMVKCKECKEEFRDKSSLERHVKNAHSSKFTCQFCKMTFSNMLTWKTHENGHNQARSSCTLCGEKFTTEKLLKKHTETKHAPEEVEGEKVAVTFYCDQCDKTYNSKKSLANHKSKAHRVVKEAEEGSIDMLLREARKAEEEAKNTIEISSDMEVEEEKPAVVEVEEEKPVVVRAEEEPVVVEIEESPKKQPSTKALADMMDDWE